MNTQNNSKKPKLAVVTNNYNGNAFIPSFITSLNSQTFLSFGEIDWIFIDATPSEGVKTLVTSRDNLNNNIKVVYVAPENPEDHLSYGQGLVEAAKHTDAVVSIKLDVDDRLSPYGAEIFFREFCAKKPLLLAGWELHTDSIASPFDELSTGFLFIPKKITTISELLKDGKNLRKACSIGNILCYNTGITSLINLDVEIYVFEALLAQLIKLGKSFEIIPEVVGCHTRHVAGLRHGFHNEEAMLAEASALMGAYKNDL